MIDSGYRCPYCHTILESRAVLSYSSTTCACSTGECTCDYSTEMVCPECSGLPQREIKLSAIFRPTVERKIEKSKKDLHNLIKNAPWLGDKKTRQREYNKYKQKQQFSKSFTKLNHQKHSRRK